MSRSCLHCGPARRASGDPGRVTPALTLEAVDNALGEFLRARRDRMTPEAAGLHVVGLRRVPGLRRAASPTPGYGAAVRIDHLILAVDDLDAAAVQLTERTGLAVVPGGVHPAWGTRNVIVPLGGAYLELVAVEHPEVAESTV